MYYLIILLLATVISAPIEDKTVLPDYPVPGNYYSGYLNVDETNQFFYFYAESQTSPQDDPLLLWLNGGPGCSSMGGWIKENGPAVMGLGSYTFEENIYSWNKITNMLWIDNPAGVGFNMGYNGSTITDEIAADQSLQAVLSFFKKFPELKSKKFIVAGESYAGIYVPFLTERILKYNTQCEPEDVINLEAMVVGDGVTDSSIGFGNGDSDYLAVLRDLVPLRIQKAYYKCLDDPTNCNPNTFQIYINDLLEIGNNNIPEGINPYHIFFECPTTPANMTGVFSPDNYKVHQNTTQDITPCAGLMGFTTYLNRADVKKALHANPYINWYQCANLNYDSVGNSIQLYPYIIQNKIRILVYSGDTDGMVPTPYTRAWLRKLNLTPKPNDNWRVWRVAGDDEELGGFLTEYEEGLTFITVHGSGHMVPQFKPKDALYFMTQFLNNEKI